jgi:hypothetical protein
LSSRQCLGSFSRSAGAVGIENAGAGDQSRLIRLDGNHHRLTELRDPEQQFGKFERQVNAAVALRIAWKSAGVESNTALGQALLEGHRCVIVGRRMMAWVFLQDHENTVGVSCPGIPEETVDTPM